MDRDVENAIEDFDLCDSKVFEKIVKRVRGLLYRFGNDYKEYVAKWRERVAAANIGVGC